MGSLLIVESSSDDGESDDDDAVIPSGTVDGASGGQLPVPSGEVGEGAEYDHDEPMQMSDSDDEICLASACNIGPAIIDDTEAETDDAAHSWEESMDIKRELDLTRRKTSVTASCMMAGGV